MRVKICGITDVEQGRAIARLGATALGFICAPQSPRYVTPSQIRSIVDGLPVNASGRPIVDRVGVFVDAPLDLIVQTVKAGNLNAVQLHGNETPRFCQQIRAQMPTIEIIKAFRVRTLEILTQLGAFKADVDSFLLDAYHPTLLGGTGETLDWSSLQDFRSDRPWFLAGGLNPANIADAITVLNPDGVDLSSGVERSPGIKDLQKVAALFDQILQTKSTL